MFYPKLVAPALLVFVTIAAATPARERGILPPPDTRPHVPGYSPPDIPDPPVPTRFELCMDQCKLATPRDCRYHCQVCEKHPLSKGC
ncbi:hypothetical protein OC846_006837 [Tilletia horrida]|uniref:Uncharacterized protein n=1 Tax=Tilletia horrida TaxID=155126 RepID=A0AAN6GIN4_9BASI|nr:hypothetical protein OC846_006837 [Tilletia horrida]KAK0563741.1 hypothetical protein OC861_004640 [Tilletia horrida]